MKILAVDDERIALKELIEAIQEAIPLGNINGFQNGQEALVFARENRVDLAFLDIEMRSMNGLVLAKCLKEIYGKTNILFVTGYKEYALDAFQISASAYLLKPVTANAICIELESLRYPVETPNSNRVKIQCFGNFGVFVDGKPLIISRKKVKELFAYLVHKNGSAVTSSEIAAVLWEDREYNRALQSQTRNTIYQLMTVLREADVEDIILKKWNSFAIDVTKISCDYYDFLKGDTIALNRYTGEYLSEFSWAEFTIGYLENKKK